MQGLTRSIGASGKTLFVVALQLKELPIVGLAVNISASLGIGARRQLGLALTAPEAALVENQAVNLQLLCKVDPLITVGTVLAFALLRRSCRWRCSGLWCHRWSSGGCRPAAERTAKARRRPTVSYGGWRSCGRRCCLWRCGSRSSVRPISCWPCTASKHGCAS